MNDLNRFEWQEHFQPLDWRQDSFATRIKSFQLLFQVQEPDSWGLVACEVGTWPEGDRIGVNGVRWQQR